MSFDSAMAMSPCDHKLLCNFPKCRAEVWEFAWVTACSHVFCDTHGSREFKHCPACSSALSGKLDILRRELAPTKEYKAMVLTGLRPDIVLDITSTALSFWSYQMGEEQRYQEYLLSRAEGQVKQLDKVLNDQKQSQELELATMRREMASLKKENDEYKKRHSEQSERIDEYKKRHSEESERLKIQERKYQKLADLFHSLSWQLNVNDIFNTDVVREASSRKSPPLFSFLEPEGAEGVSNFMSPPRDRSKPYTKKP